MTNEQFSKLSVDTQNSPNILPQKVSSFTDEKKPWYKKKSGKILIGLIILIIIAVIAIAIAVPLSKKSKPDDQSQSSKTDGDDDDDIDKWAGPNSGGNGSVVKMEDGTEFVYNSTFGGHWSSSPLDESAQAQDYVPPLSKQWDYQNMLIHGVNLGGWFAIEPFISPSLFEPFNPEGSTETPTVIDEWTLSVALGDKLAETLENHYNTFYTEKDFAEIAGAGLSWVRIPISFWIVDSREGEPFLGNVGWKYFLKALEWARKYGLRVNLDLHTIPGSQNGYNHSGKQGSINFLNGAMGLANTQRSLSIIRTLTQFISQPQYKNLIPMFSILNEPYATTITLSPLRSFYLEAYDMIRNIGGTGEGNGPFIVFSDGFASIGKNLTEGGWLGWMDGLDRVGLDSHTYLCFASPNDDSLPYQATKPCAYWASNLNATSAAFGLTMGGEWSLAFNDCGQWINNVGNGARYEGEYIIPGSPAGTEPQFKAVGDCDKWTKWNEYTDETKVNLNLVARAHMDAFRNWFFWTWKTGVSTRTGLIVNPFWNYQLGLREGWMPKDPRTAAGTCEYIINNQGINMVFNPVSPLADNKVGKVEPKTDQVERSLYPWPPVTIGGGTLVENLPYFTNTGPIITLTGEGAISGPTNTLNPSGSVITKAPGWTKPDDGQGGYFVPVNGCSYPDPWNGVKEPVPSTRCVGGVGEEVTRNGIVSGEIPVETNDLARFKLKKKNLVINF